MVHVLLHLIEGKADELDVYEEVPANKLLSEIDPSSLELYCSSLVRR